MRPNNQKIIQSPNATATSTPMKAMPTKASDEPGESSSLRCGSGAGRLARALLWLSVCAAVDGRERYDDVFSPVIDLDRDDLPLVAPALEGVTNVRRLRRQRELG